MTVRPLFRTILINWFVFFVGFMLLLAAWPKEFAADHSRGNERSAASAHAGQRVLNPESQTRGAK